MRKVSFAHKYEYTIGEEEEPCMIRKHVDWIM
jgi:hypothetical protein